MRRSLSVFFGAILFLVLVAVYQVSTLIALLFEDGSADAIPHAELPAPNSALVDSPKFPAMIPKILHQTYVNTSIPPVWKEAQESCLELHQDWEYKVRDLHQYRTGRFKLGLTKVHAAVDRRTMPRLHQDRVPLVPRHLCRLLEPDPARRHDQILRAPAFWRHLCRFG